MIFEYIDGQLISKMAAHFACLKLSKCALKFLMYWHSTYYKIARTRTSTTFTFPDRTDEECRQNGCKNDCQISSQGKVPPIRGKLVHFPGKNGDNGSKINIFEGKVHQMTGKMVHFLPELTHATLHYPTLQMYTSNYPDFDPDFANGHLKCAP